MIRSKWQTPSGMNDKITDLDLCASFGKLFGKGI